MKIPHFTNSIAVLLAGMVLAITALAAALGAETASDAIGHRDGVMADLSNGKKSTASGSEAASVEDTNRSAVKTTTAGTKSGTVTTKASSGKLKSSSRSSISADNQTAPISIKSPESVDAGSVLTSRTDESEDMEEPADDHKIAPLETLRIDVFEERELTAPELRVQASGKIKYFLLDEIHVAGKTAREVADFIEKTLKARGYLVNPHVIVTVNRYRLRYVNVLGEVVQPKAYPLQEETKWTIMDAIGLAGGLTRAARDKVQFTRNGKTTYYDIDKLIKDPKLQIIVEPGDTIFVPPSFW